MQKKSLSLLEGNTSVLGLLLKEKEAIEASANRKKAGYFLGSQR